METTPFTSKPTLRSELVTLRPIRAEDADLIEAILRADDELARLTGSVHSSTEMSAGMPIERLREIHGDLAVADGRLVLVVIDNATDDLVGEVVLNEWDEDNGSCGFRTFIGAAGRGLGTEATRLVVEHGLTVMGLHRIPRGLRLQPAGPPRLQECRLRPRRDRPRGAALRRPVDRRALHGDPRRLTAPACAASPTPDVRQSNAVTHASRGPSGAAVTGGGSGGWECPGRQPGDRTRGGAQAAARLSGGPAVEGVSSGTASLRASTKAVNSRLRAVPWSPASRVVSRTKPRVQLRPGRCFSAPQISRVRSRGARPARSPSSAR